MPIKEPAGPGTSDDPRRLLDPDPSASSTRSAAAFKAAIWSASLAAASASGISGMVSNDDILGLRERKLVGVEGMDDADELE